MKVKLKLSDLFFYISYVMWMVTYVLQQTFYKDLFDLQIGFRIVRIMVYILLFMKIICDKSYSKKSIFYFVFIIFISIVISFRSDTTIIFDAVIFIYSARNLNIRNIIKLTLIMQIVVMSFVVLSSCLGIIKNDIWYRYDGMPRYGMGYTYCSFLSNYYFNIVLMYFYLKEGKKIYLKEISLIFAINYIIYIFTDTRAVFYLINIIIITVYLCGLSKKPIKNGIVNKVMFQYSFLISALFSIFVSINYNGMNNGYIFLNKLFNGRLVLGYAGYKEFGISLLGQKINWIGGSNGIENGIDAIYNFVDCSYLNIILNYGLIMLVMVCIGFIIVGKISIENNKRNFCLILFFLAIHSITDPQLLDLKYNTFLFTISCLFNVRKDDNKFIYYKLRNLQLNS